MIAGAWSTVRVKVWVASGCHAVGGGDREAVGAAGARGGGAGEGGGAVAVVDEGHAAGSAPVSLRRRRSGMPVVVTVKRARGARR